jgi:hypothetical protein
MSTLWQGWRNDFLQMMQTNTPNLKHNGFADKNWLFEKLSENNSKYNSSWQFLANILEKPTFAKTYILLEQDIPMRKRVDCLLLFPQCRGQQFFRKSLLIEFKFKQDQNDVDKTINQIREYRAALLSLPKLFTQDKDYFQEPNSCFYLHSTYVLLTTSEGRNHFRDQKPDDVVVFDSVKFILENLKNYFCEESDWDYQDTPKNLAINLNSAVEAPAVNP